VNGVGVLVIGGGWYLIQPTGATTAWHVPDRLRAVGYCLSRILSLLRMGRAWLATGKHFFRKTAKFFCLPERV